MTDKLLRCEEVIKTCNVLKEMKNVQNEIRRDQGIARFIKRLLPDVTDESLKRRYMSDIIELESEINEKKKDFTMLRLKSSKLCKT